MTFGICLGDGRFYKRMGWMKLKKKFINFSIWYNKLLVTCGIFLFGIFLV